MCKHLLGWLKTHLWGRGGCHRNGEGRGEGHTLADRKGSQSHAVGRPPGPGRWGWSWRRQDGSALLPQSTPHNLEPPSRLGRSRRFPTPTSRVCTQAGLLINGHPEQLAPDVPQAARLTRGPSLKTAKLSGDRVGESVRGWSGKKQPSPGKGWARAPVGFSRTPGPGQTA